MTLVALGSTVSTIFAVYALSFAVDTHGLDKTTMLWVAIVTNVVALAAIPLWATLADRIGRKPVFVTGALVSGALMFAYLAAIASETYVLIFAAAIAMSGIAYSAFNGVQPSLYGEMFPTRVRLSGMALGTQIGYAIGGFAPTAAAAIDGAGWMPGRRCTCSGRAVIAAIAALTARETCRRPLDDIDGRRGRFSRDHAVSRSRSESERNVRSSLQLLAQTGEQVVDVRQRDAERLGGAGGVEAGVVRRVHPLLRRADGEEVLVEAEGGHRAAGERDAVDVLGADAVQRAGRARARAREWMSSAASVARIGVAIVFRPGSSQTVKGRPSRSASTTEATR